MAKKNLVHPYFYLAGPLFSSAEHLFNTNLKKGLSSFFDVYLPQEDGGLMVEMIEKGMVHKNAAQRVFSWDLEAMKRCDVFLIILDGRAIDEGASFELGYAYALGKPCYGLQTDIRRLLPVGNNPMIDCALKKIFKSEEELIAWAKQYSQEKINAEMNNKLIR